MEEELIVFKKKIAMRYKTGEMPKDFKFPRLVETNSSATRPLLSDNFTSFDISTILNKGSISKTSKAANTYSEPKTGRVQSRSKERNSSKNKTTVL